jgi:phosphonates import ATP-binding protein phnC
LLLKEVSLILADEPTTSLDIEMASSVIELLKKLNETYKITIIINMHDLDLVKKYFKKIICLKNGEIIKVCEPNNMDNELLQMLYN